MTYTLSQSINYNYNLSIEYILNNHFTDKKYNQFNDKINLSEVLSFVSDKLNDKNKINKLTFYDIYIIPADYGKNNEKYLKVITLPNTKCIIDMYPTNNMYVQDNYESQLESKVRVYKYKSNNKEYKLKK